MLLYSSFGKHVRFGIVPVHTHSPTHIDVRTLDRRRWHDELGGSFFSFSLFILCIVEMKARAFFFKSIAAKFAQTKCISTIVNSEWRVVTLNATVCLWQLSHASSRKKKIVTNSKHTGFYDTLNENVHKLISTCFVSWCHVSSSSSFFFFFFLCVHLIVSYHRVKAHLFLAHFNLFLVNTIHKQQTTADCCTIQTTHIHTYITRMYFNTQNVHGPWSTDSTETQKTNYSTVKALMMKR